MTGGHNRYHNRTQGEQSKCMVSDYDSMRLVHRRNNPNKETLIYIPLSHIIVILVHTMDTYYYYYSSDPYISVCVLVCIPTHIHPYIARRGLLTEADGELITLLIVVPIHLGPVLEAQSPPIQ